MYNVQFRKLVRDSKRSVFLIKNYTIPFTPVKDVYFWDEDSGFETEIINITWHHKESLFVCDTPPDRSLYDTHLQGIKPTQTLDEVVDIWILGMGGN